MARVKMLPAFALALSACIGSVQADVQIGNWEQAPDGWIDWGTQAAVTSPKYEYSTGGATSGTYALQLNQAGWNQNLAIKLQDNGLNDDFMQYTKLRIDVTAPATTVSGWSKIEEVIINAQGASWGDYKITSPVQFGWGDGGGGAQTGTIVFDYTAFHSDPDVLALGHAPWWIEIIIATNSDANHGVLQFDNARLTDPVPEPALLGVAAMAMLGTLRRRRH